MVHDHTFAFEQNADPAVAEPTPLAGNLLHLLAYLSAVRRAFSTTTLAGELGSQGRTPAEKAPFEAYYSEGEKVKADEERYIADRYVFICQGSSRCSRAGRSLWLPRLPP